MRIVIASYVGVGINVVVAVAVNVGIVAVCVVVGDVSSGDVGVIGDVGCSANVVVYCGVGGGGCVCVALVLITLVY